LLEYQVPIRIVGVSTGPPEYKFHSIYQQCTISIKNDCDYPQSLFKLTI